MLTMMWCMSHNYLLSKQKIAGLGLGHLIEKRMNFDESGRIAQCTSKSLSRSGIRYLDHGVCIRGKGGWAP